MTAVLALVACGAWGYSTHAAAGGAQAWGTLRLTAWSQFFGLGLMVPWLILSRPAAIPDDALYGVLAGLGSGTSLALLYDAVSRMSPGLAASVSGTIAAVVPLLHTVAVGTPPSLFTAASLLPCVAGVTFVAIGRRSAAPPAAGTRATGTLALYEAALSGAAMGVYYITLSRVHEPAFAITEARIVATVLLLGVLAIWSRPGGVSWPARAPLSAVVLVGVTGATGTIAYGYAADMSTLVSVVAIVSVAPAVTAWLGRWRTAERLGTVQVCGLLACVAGAALAAISTING
jgi:drug/metabolite transporter (DMT)-like permease